MGFRINGSIIVATVIFAGVGGYMATGDIIRGGVNDPSIPTIAERNAEKSSEAFMVRTAIVSPQERRNLLPVRGRTKAETIVPIRAETGGVVQERLVAKGQMVSPGDLVCRIDPGTRQSSVAEAQAAVDQARFDLDANEKLLERGFATPSQVQALRAGLNRAQAQLDGAQKELDRTEVVATVGGIVQDPVAEVGDNLTTGGACVTLVDLDPMLLTVQVSEQDVFAVQNGQRAVVELVNGERFSGEVTFVGSSSDPQTRTFTTDIRLPNPDGKILDGISAQGAIELGTENAFLIQPSWVVQNDNGQIGVRVVAENNVVDFIAVDVIDQEREGLWVNGLEAGTQIITLGQDFVVVGETVRTSPDSDPLETAALMAPQATRQSGTEEVAQ